MHDTVKILLAISPYMTYKTGQMSVRLHSVNIFNILLGLRDRWTHVDETWHGYFVGLGTQLLGSGMLNFSPCAALDHPELSPVGRDDQP